MITWFGWTLIGIWGLNALLTVSKIGDPRKPITRGDAITGFIIGGLWLWGLLAVGTGHL